MLGFGSIGQGTLPLILKHIKIDADNITVISPEKLGMDEIKQYGVHFYHCGLTKANYREVLTPIMKKGDFLVNLSVRVSTCALVELCQELEVLYVDACIEPWEGGYTDAQLTVDMRSNYALREEARNMKGTTTAVLAHGANPGLVSHLVKQALLNIQAAVAQDAKLKTIFPAKDDLTQEQNQDVNTDKQPVSEPKTRDEWARLAKELGVKVIHIAERDTQKSTIPKAVGEFVNTWSVDGFVSEGCQPSELGWGTHEREMPAKGKQHKFGCGSAIYLNQPGAATRVRSWTPLEGPYHGFLITHNEAISISDYFTEKKGDKVIYRPTVHYAYHPCDDCVMSLHEFAGKNWTLQPKIRILNQEISSGTDELGVLLMGHAKNAYWFGSRLSIDQARKLCPFNNATGLQVTSAVLAGMIWAIENPTKGIVEAEEMDHKRILEICMPYLGEVVGQFSDWTPLEGRQKYFEEDLDTSDPWQFKNILV